MKRKINKLLDDSKTLEAAHGKKLELYKYITPISLKNGTL